LPASLETGAAGHRGGAGFPVSIVLQQGGGNGGFGFGAQNRFGNDISTLLGRSRGRDVVWI